MSARHDSAGSHPGAGESQTALLQADSTTLAAAINSEHAFAFGAAHAALEHARRAGELLLQAKAEIEHGAWLPWIEQNCKFSARQAQRYMTVAENWTAISAKNDTVSHLTLRGALRLLAGSESDAGDSLTLPPKGSDWDTVWAWAGWQIAAPINAFDLDAREGLRSKVRTQLGIAAETAVLLQNHSKENPILRLASSENLIEALKLLAPVTKKKSECKFDIDASLSMYQITQIWSTIVISAYLDIGTILNEFDARKKYNKSDGYGLWKPDGYGLWLSDRKKIADSWLAHLNGQIAEFEAAA